MRVIEILPALMACQLETCSFCYTLPVGKVAIMAGLKKSQRFSCLVIQIYVIKHGEINTGNLLTVKIDPHIPSGIFVSSLVINFNSS